MSLLDARLAPANSHGGRGGGGASAQQTPPHGEAGAGRAQGPGGQKRGATGGKSPLTLSSRRLLSRRRSKNCANPNPTDGLWLSSVNSCVAPSRVAVVRTHSPKHS